MIFRRSRQQPAKVQIPPRRVSASNPISPRMPAPPQHPLPSSVTVVFKDSGAPVPESEE